MNNKIRIVCQTCQSEITIQKSKFITTVIPVNSIEDATLQLNLIKKKYYDANHNCSAFVIGNNYENEKASDDGEPSLTAGKPILNVIKGANLTNTMIVVTRYFGGIKLGTGGLVRAYTDAAKAGLQQSQIAIKCLGKIVKIHTDYITIGKVLHELGQRGIKQESSEYTDVIVLTVIVPSEDIDNFDNTITEISAGKTVLEVMEEVYFEKME